MRWFKKIVRAILALLPVFSIFFICNGSSYALKYEYMSSPYANSVHPADNCYELVDGSYQIKSDCADGLSTYAGSRFSYGFNHLSNDAYDDISFQYSNSFIGLNIFNQVHIYPQFSYYANNKMIRYIGNDFYSPNIWNFESLDSSLWRRGSIFGDNGLRTFSLDFIDLTSTLSCKSLGYDTPGGSNWNNANGAVCPGLWKTREYVSDQILNYPYSSDGFYYRSNAISSSTGENYSHTLNLSDIFKNIPSSFSYFTIPMGDDGGLFDSPSELYSGREFNFNGEFSFTGSFTWNPQLSNNGSSWRIRYYGISATTGQDSGTLYADCTVNQTLVDGHNHLSYSCPLTLTDTYLWLDFAMVIDGNGDYVFQTDGTWNFANVFVTTDNNWADGGKLNEQRFGGGSIPGDAQNDIDSDNSFDLMNLFSFSIPLSNTPLTGILGNFSDQSSCASIPIIAGLIHSNETQVCPWFNSTVRNIATPILSLFSVLLVFGFIIRWLNSGSASFKDEKENR